MLQMDIIAKKIKLARCLLELNQSQLALKMNTSQSVISRWEQGIVEIRLSEINKLSEVTGFDVYFFLSGESF